LPVRVLRSDFCRALTACHRSLAMIRSSGTSCVIHSDSGFGRETRFPVSGSIEDDEPCAYFVHTEKF
jgi:hypothetical protein